MILGAIWIKILLDDTFEEIIIQTEVNFIRALPFFALVCPSTIAMSAGLPEF